MELLPKTSPRLYIFHWLNRKLSCCTSYTKLCYDQNVMKVDARTEKFQVFEYCWGINNVGVSIVFFCIYGVLEFFFFFVYTALAITITGMKNAIPTNSNIITSYHSAIIRPAYASFPFILDSFTCVYRCVTDCQIQECIRGIEVRFGLDDGWIHSINSRGLHLTSYENWLSLRRCNWDSILEAMS